MNIATNLRGRIKNTALPYTKGLLPVFETISNSIHAIEDAELPMEQGRITLEIVRSGEYQIALELDKEKPGTKPRDVIVGFKITDNGIGFTDKNMVSFRTLDSDYKEERGGRGVGRLLWLKAFAQASITSTFLDEDGITKCRKFTFRPKDGIVEEIEESVPDGHKSTCVHLEKFKEKYSESSPKKVQTIANNILDHCLWYFMREGGAPRITVIDGEEKVILNDVYDRQIIREATPDTIQIKDEDFGLMHIKLSATSSRDHSIAFCAAHRVVKEEKIKGEIPGLFGTLKDDRGNFIYQCYVTSSFLDEHVRSERIDFNIVDEPQPLFAEREISFKEILDAVIMKATEFLAEYLDENKRLGKEHTLTFINTKAPRYRPIIARIPEDELVIDPETPEKDIELHLHEHLANIEYQILSEGHDLMKLLEYENLPDYKNRLKSYLNNVTDIKKSDLAGYVAHRKVIIDLLAKAIERQEDGKYVREELIHNLIMPMRKDSTEVSLDRCNLWLIDERLAFHDYLASDKPFRDMPITDDVGGQKPDLLAFRIFDKPILLSESKRPPFASLVIVEIKRPMRNDAGQREDKDPIKQIMDYLDLIKQSKVTTSMGRPINNSDGIPKFCYVICDLTPRILSLCKRYDATPTNDEDGYFFYSKSYKAYFEVISFDRLVNAAKERSRAFFDKLGLPST